MVNKKFRWKYFIDKPFQTRFIARFFLLIFIGLGLSLAAIGVSNLKRFDSPLYFQTKKLTAEDTKMMETMTPEAKFIYSINTAKPLNSFDLLWQPLVYISLLYLVLIAVFGLFITHKMAGPVYRIKKTLDEASSGKLEIKDLKFRLRKNDELKDLVDALNKFLDKVSYKK